MKKAVLIFGVILLGIRSIQATILFRNSATNLNSGTLNPSRVNPSTFTMYGPIIPVTAVDGSVSNTVLGPIIAGSTRTMTFKIPNVYISTIEACGIPMACHSPGISTITIIGYWADAIKGSSAGYTGIKFAVSTGGANGFPIQDRFNNTTISLTTATALGYAAYSGYTSTNIVIRAGETFGVQISSFANSGIVTQGLMVHFDYWEVSRY